MNVFFALLPFLPVLFIVFGVLYGLRRGTKKSIIRLAIIMATTFALFLLCQPITRMIINALPFTADLTRELAEYGIADGMILDTVVGLFAPLVFLILFIIVNAISWIFFAIFTRRVENNGKLGGVIVGFIAGFFISIFFMFPFNGYASLHKDLENINTIFETLEIDAGFMEWLEPLANYNNNAIVRAYNVANRPMFEFATGGVAADIREISEIIRDAATLIDMLRDGIDIQNMTLEDATELGEILDRLAAVGIITNTSIGDVLGLIGGDNFDINDLLNLEELDGIDVAKIGELIDEISDIRISDFNFSVILPAIVENDGDINEIVDLLPQSVRNIIDKFTN